MQSESYVSFATGEHRPAPVNKTMSSLIHLLTDSVLTFEMRRENPDLTFYQMVRWSY